MTIHIRSIAPIPNTVDLEARTVEAIVSTGAEAPRPGYTERLDLSGADLSRLIGAPVLDAHRSGSTSDQLGVTEAAELRPEGLWVRIKFRSNTIAQAVLSDVADGTLRGLSIGYTVSEWKDERRGKQRIRVASKWTPIEVSIVPVPADAGAHFRNGVNMENEEQTEDRTEDQVHTRAEMNAEIRVIATTAGLTRSWADEQIDAEATPEDARRAAFEAMQTRSRETTRTTRATIGQDNTDPAQFIERAGEALFARSHPDHELSGPARQYAGMSLGDMAAEALRVRGVATRGLTSAEAIITRALHTASDYPEILGNAVGRELRRAYNAPVSGVRQLARQTTARDFRAKSAVLMGEAPKLEKVNEAGEFKSGTIAESGESYSVETFGKIFSISRQAMVNDDLGAFTRIPAMMGNAARAFEAQQLVDKITSNPVLSDGVEVFDTDDHGNLKAVGASLKADLSAARLAMRKQTGLTGELIDVTPRFVLVPAELETDMEQALAEIQATKTDDVNPFAKLSLAVEPRLTSATQWYVVADPNAIDGLEYAYLEGAPGPQIETRAGFEVDGTQIKVRLDFGSGWIDHRGWFRVG